MAEMETYPAPQEDIMRWEAKERARIANRAHTAPGGWRTLPWSVAFINEHANENPAVHGHYAICPRCKVKLGPFLGFKTREAADEYLARSIADETHPLAFCERMSSGALPPPPPPEEKPALKPGVAKEARPKGQQKVV